MAAMTGEQLAGARRRQLLQNSGYTLGFVVGSISVAPSPPPAPPSPPLPPSPGEWVALGAMWLCAVSMWEAWEAEAGGWGRTAAYGLVRYGDPGTSTCGPRIRAGWAGGKEPPWVLSSGQDGVRAAC